MEFGFDRSSDARERLEFVRTYAVGVRRTPNEEWSWQQAVLIDTFFENAVNIPLSSREYLEKITGRKNSR